MTIKQQGGVFGRNPTFNEVKVEGDLSIDGQLTIAGEVITGLSYQGGWNADTNNPDIAASAPATGQFWIVTVDGSTDVGGITNWTVGDWALFDGTNWQRVEGGNTDLDTGVSGTLKVLNGGTGANTAADARTNLGLVIGTDVEAADSTILKSADIGVTVQGYDANTAKTDVSQVLTASQTFGNNAKLIFGNAGDLEIYSTGTASYIRETGSGDLQIYASDDVFIRGTSTNNYMARFREVGSVELYHNNIRKFQTAATGISVEGNVAVTNGGGIDFSATAGTGTSELFDDYEEGTWTPAFSAEWTTPPSVTSAQYTKIGRQVTVTLLASGGVVTAGGSITGLPFASNSAQGAGAYGGNSDTTESLQGTVGQSASSITNIPVRMLTGDTWQITATYFT